MLDLHPLLRRERDSNPRYSCPYTAFRVRPDRPLRHLSLKIVPRNHRFGTANIDIFFISAHFRTEKIASGRKKAPDGGVCPPRVASGSGIIPIFVPKGPPAGSSISPPGAFIEQGSDRNTKTGTVFVFSERTHANRSVL